MQSKILVDFISNINLVNTNLDNCGPNQIPSCI